MKERILVIRLGALGDLILCCQAFHEIRQAHKDAEIVLLTMPNYAQFARTMPWFDRVIVDERAPPLKWRAWRRLLSEIKKFKPTRVYDLQGKFRQTVLFNLLGGPLGPQWSGAAPLCSHPRLWPPEEGMHFTDFVAAQLRRADVPSQDPVDFSWLDTKMDNDQPRFALFMAGCTPGREYKRWPAENYAALANRLKLRLITGIVIGNADDKPIGQAIRALDRDVVDITGKTSLQQVAALARRAVCVIGNDTGPTHIAAAVGAPTLALFSDQVNPVWSSPRGPNVQYLQGEPISALDVDKVFLALEPMLDAKLAEGVEPIQQGMQ